jgi:hypothetical protein
MGYGGADILQLRSSYRVRKALNQNGGLTMPEDKTIVRQRHFAVGHDGG